MFRFNSQLSKVAVIGIMLVIIIAAIFWVLRPYLLTPEQIIAHTAKVYANCNSYQDSGEVESRLASNSIEINGHFNTVLVRPHHFRYEFIGKWIMHSNDGTKSRKVHYIVWREGKEVVVYQNLRKPRIDTRDSLAAALAGATAVSGGLATDLTGMLFPNEADMRMTLTDFTDVSRLPDATIKGKACYCIKGKMADQDIKVWIDKSTFLVRRMDWDGDIKNTTTWNSSVNKKIPDEDLSLKIPQGEPLR